MRTLARIALFAAVCVIPIARPAAAENPSPSPAGEKVYVLGIEGMMCDQSCPAKVKESIESLEGVRAVEVDFDQKRAVVRTDPGVELTAQQIDKSFHNLGYFVSSLQVESGK